MKNLDPTSVLGAIVARTRSDLAAREEARPLFTFEGSLQPAPRDFANALRGRRGTAQTPHLIAELKLRSPSRGAIRVDASPATVVPIYARYASAISVLCDAPFFGGGFDKLQASAALCDAPLLCKDFVVSRYQIAEARESGASGVLLMASVLDDDTLCALLAYARSLGMEALVETHDDDELSRALDAGASVVGVNSRDLRTLAIDFERMLTRLDRVPRDNVCVAESGVTAPEHVDALRGRSDAVLIGSALMAADDIESAIVSLGFEPHPSEPS